jgi:hypothetical protein
MVAAAAVVVVAAVPAEVMEISFARFSDKHSSTICGNTTLDDAFTVRAHTETIPYSAHFRETQRTAMVWNELRVTNRHNSDPYLREVFSLRSSATVSQHSLNSASEYVKN